MDRYRWFLFGFGVLLISAAAQAQQVGGCALQGRVIDQQQAVLPGVTIIITNQDTGTFREHTKGLTVSALFRYMTGRPFTIMDSTVDADRNGILFDPLPAGTYSGVGRPR